ncbi:MAG: GAM-1 protein [Psittacine adenovirus 12]
MTIDSSDSRTRSWFCGSTAHIGTISFSTLISAPAAINPLTDPETYMRQKLTEAVYKTRGLNSAEHTKWHSEAVYHCRAIFNAAVYRKKHYFLQNAHINIEIPSSQLSKHEKENYLKDVVSKMFNVSIKAIRAAGLCLDAAEGRLGIQFSFHSDGFRIPDSTALKIMLASLKVEVNDAAGSPYEHTGTQGFTQTFTVQRNSSTDSLNGTFSREALLKSLQPMYRNFIPSLANTNTGEGLCSQVATKVQGGCNETWTAHIHQPNAVASPISLRNASTLALVKSCLAAQHSHSNLFYPAPFHPYCRK